MIDIRFVEVKIVVFEVAHLSGSVKNIANHEKKPSKCDSLHGNAQGIQAIQPDGRRKEVLTGSTKEWSSFEHLPWKQRQACDVAQVGKGVKSWGDMSFPHKACK